MLDLNTYVCAACAHEFPAEFQPCRCPKCDAMGGSRDFPSTVALTIARQNDRYRAALALVGGPVGLAILAGIARGRTHIVLPARIGWLARLLNLLPGALHDRLLQGQPRKLRVGEAGATAIPGLYPPGEPRE